MTRLLSIVPFPPRLDAAQGGPRALAELLTRLAQRMPVALLALRAPGEPHVDPALERACELVHEVPRAAPQRWSLRHRLGVGAALVRGTPAWAYELHAPAMHEAIARTTREWQPDVAQVEFGVMGQYLATLPAEVPKVLVVHDLAVGSPPQAVDGGIGDRVRARLDRRAWARFEPAAFAAADAAVVFTERDRHLVQSRARGTSVHVIPLGTMLGRQVDPIGTEPAVLFVGSFVHPPNVDGARFLVTEILPLVRRRCPDAVAYVVGETPPPGIRRLAGDGVVVTGRVASVEPYLERVAVVAAPLRLGGGMRVKVLEALGAGKAVVATPLGVSGLAVVDGVHALIRDDAVGLADAIAGLLVDGNRRSALGRAARTWAEAQPSWDDAADAYARLHASLLER